MGLSKLAHPPDSTPSGVNWYHLHRKGVTAAKFFVPSAKLVPSVNWYHLRKGSTICQLVPSAKFFVPSRLRFRGAPSCSNPLSYLIIPPFFEYILIRIGAYNVLDITGALIREAALYINWLVCY